MSVEYLFKRFKKTLPNGHQYDPNVLMSVMQFTRYVSDNKIRYAKPKFVKNNTLRAFLTKVKCIKLFENVNEFTRTQYINDPATYNADRNRRQYQLTYTDFIAYLNDTSIHKYDKWRVNDNFTANVITSLMTEDFRFMVENMIDCKTAEIKPLYAQDYNHTVSWFSTSGFASVVDNFKNICQQFDIYNSLSENSMIAIDAHDIQKIVLDLHKVICAHDDKVSDALFKMSDYDDEYVEMIKEKLGKGFKNVKHYKDDYYNYVLYVYKQFYKILVAADMEYDYNRENNYKIYMTIG